MIVVFFILSLCCRCLLHLIFLEGQILALCPLLRQLKQQTTERKKRNVVQNTVIMITLYKEVGTINVGTLTWLQSIQVYVNRFYFRGTKTCIFFQKVVKNMRILIDCLVVHFIYLLPLLPLSPSPYFFRRTDSGFMASTMAGVTWNFVCGHFTSAKPKHTEHPTSTTLASGVAPSTGKLFDATRPLLRTVTGVLRAHCSCRPKGSYLMPLHVPYVLMRRAWDAWVSEQSSQGSFAFLQSVWNLRQ